MYIPDRDQRADGTVSASTVVPPRGGARETRPTLFTQVGFESSTTPVR